MDVTGSFNKVGIPDICYRYSLTNIDPNTIRETKSPVGKVRADMESAPTE